MKRYRPNEKFIAYWAELFQISREYGEMVAFLFKGPTRKLSIAERIMSAGEFILMTGLIILEWVFLPLFSPFVYVYWVLEHRTNKYDSLGGP